MKMQSSKFKGILLFLVSFMVFTIVPTVAKAATYNFSFSAYNCGNSTYTEDDIIDNCILEYYDGNLAKLNDGVVVDTDKYIMLVLEYEYTSGTGAAVLSVDTSYDNTFVENLSFTQTAIDADNPIFTRSIARKWNSSTSDTGSLVVLAYDSDDETLTYDPGAIGFMFFKVKDTAPAGQTFTFAISDDPDDTRVSDSTGNIHIDWAASPISFKVAGSATSTDTSLKTLNAKGSNATDYSIYMDNGYTTEFSAGTSNRTFYAVVPYDVTSITLNGEVTDSAAQFIPGNGTTYSRNHNLDVGNNEITFRVTAQSGTTEDYYINVYRLSNDASLQTLTTSGNVTLNGFASNVYSYDISTTYATVTTNVTSKPTHENAFVTNSEDVLWDKNTSSGSYTQTFALPGFGTDVNTKVVKVQAEDCLSEYASVPGNTCHTQDYTINVSRLNPSTDATLKALAVDGTSIFVEGTTDYDQGSQPYSKSSADITATANDSKATVVASTVGNKTLNVGDNTITVTVEAEDCKVITGSNPSGSCHTQDYTIKFYRRSNNANLNTLVVTGTGVSMNPAFTDHSYVGPYTVSYPSGATSVNVKASVEEEHATINITGIEDGIDYSNLSNQLSIIVTAEDGNTKTYVLRFSKVLSRESRLDSLTVSGVSLSPSPFDPDTYTYSGSVDGNVEKVTIGATLKDADKSTFMEGYGPREVELNYGDNTFYVRVQGEADDATSSYNVTITRNEKTIKTLKEISIDSVPIDPFDPDTITYTVDPVDYSTTSVTVKAVVTEGSDATYTVLNQSGGVAVGGVINLNTGDNTVTIRVRAQDGSTGDYTVTIPREKNNVATVDSVTVFGNAATCDNDTRKCTITVTNDHSSIAPTDVVVIPTDSSATVTKPTDTRNLVVSTPSNPRTNTYIFSVKAEDGVTTKEYELIITREASDDVSLKEVSVFTNEGQTYRCTTFTGFACTISVPSTTTGYTLSATPNSGAATVDGTGSFTMDGASDSSQIKVLTVTAEDEHSQVYQIKIERSKSTNANLKTITIDGVEIDGFDGVNKQNYTVTVPGTTEAITLGAEVDDTGKATIENSDTILGRKDLVYGSEGNVYTLKVIAEAGEGSVKTYTVTVIRSNNIDSTLSMIQIGGSNLNGFASNTYAYNYNDTYYQDLGNENQLVVPYNKTSITLLGVPTDTTYGTVKYNGTASTEATTINLTTGVNTITVTGVAHDTSKTTDYVLKVFRTLNSNNSITKLEVAGVEATWDDENNKYTVTVPNSVDSVGTLNVNVTLPAKQVATDPDATVTIPTMSLTTDNVNNYQIIVTSEAGEAKTYPVEITRAKSTVKTLTALAVTNGAFSPSFTPNTNEYTVIVPASTTEFTVSYTKADPKETVTGARRYDMTSSNMDVIVEVQAEDPEEPVNRYTLHIERTESAVNTLSSIVVNSGETIYALNPLFSPDKTSYVVEVPGTVSQVNITATPTDSRSTVTGDGVKTVSRGDNTFTITSTSETNTFINYTVNVKVLDKTINTLNNITVTLDDGTVLPLSPNFASDIQNYTIADQPYSVTTVNIGVERTDSDSTVKIGNVDYTMTDETNGITVPQSLNAGANTIKVVVTAQDGTSSTYNIRIRREENDDATLRTLNVSGGSLSPTFAPEITSYSVELDSDVTTLSPSEVTAIATDSNATVTKDPTVTISDDGTTIYDILVTAQNGTTKTYSITVSRKKSADAKLKRVDLTGASISPSFTPNNDQYTLNISSTSTEFTIQGIPNHDNATVSYNGVGSTEGITYPASTDTVSITVTAEDGSTTKTYTFNVVTATARDATLADLEVLGYTLDPEFDTTTVVYDIGEVEFGTDSLTIIATPTNTNATVNYYVDGVKQDDNVVDLPQALGSKSITIEVVPATGSKAQAKYYSVNYDMVTSRNNYLATLIPSSGTLSPSFSKGRTAYSMTVPYDTESISFQVTTDNNQSSVSNDGTTFMFTDAEPATYVYNDLRVGTNTMTFTVRAANGALRDYVVTVTKTGRTPSSDVYLSSLKVDNYELTPSFDKTEEVYSIGSIPYSLQTLTVRATGNYAGQTITYSLNGTDVTANDDGSATINVAGTTGSNLINVHVVAENGTSTKNYQISYTKTPSSNAYLASMIDGLHKITNFNKETKDYEISVDSTVGTLTLTLTTEEEHATMTINGTKRTHQWAYEATNLKGGTNVVVILVTAENGDTATYKLTINKEGSSELITSEEFGHIIEDGFIKTAILNETIGDLMSNELDNDVDMLQVWDAEETAEINDTSTKVATGQIVRLVDRTTGAELDRKVVVVRGDTDGNGSINVLDSIPIVNQSLRRLTLVGAYAQAADVDKNGSINVLDSIPIVNHSLRRTFIDYTIGS
ncbi:MAG: cadherin-like beta sandwich domain-containing protein [Bacilli bacterium]|nr:cadherin-like beta sandwich domain-containing protein [Bacilli bacterium]